MRPAAVSARGVESVVLKTPAASPAWQLGTILKALALGDAAGGNVRLQIGARVVTAQTSLPLQAGQTLRLQVAEIGRAVVLRTVGDMPQGDLVRDGIRQNLPRQMPQTSLLSAALSAVRTGAQRPVALTTAATRLVGTLTDAGAVTNAQGLRQAVRNSGTFLESGLAQASGATNRPHAAPMPLDWKAALLRFRDQLTQLQVRMAGDGGDSRSSRPAAQSPVANVAIPPVGAGPPRPPGAPIAAANLAGAQANGPASVLPAMTGAAPATSPAAALPTILSPAGAPVAGTPLTSTQAVDSVGQKSAAMTQLSAPAHNSPPPMRHALPQSQPVVQPVSQGGDALTLISELISQSDGALARVRLNQLASITPDHTSRLVWLLELPVRHADNRAEVVTLRIERDDDGNGNPDESAWTAELAFDLGAKGALRARVALRAGRVSVLFFADADRTRTEVQEKLPLLKTAMEKKQLDVATLTASATAPAQPQAPPASVLEMRA